MKGGMEFLLKRLLYRSINNLIVLTLVKGCLRFGLTEDSRVSRDLSS